MDPKNSKLPKNPLLQTAHHVFDFADVNTMPLLIPTSKEVSGEELDSFIGQEAPNRSDVTSSASSQSVPLIVPSEQNCSRSDSAYSASFPQNSVSQIAHAQSYFTSSLINKQNLEEKNLQNPYSYSKLPQTNSTPSEYSPVFFNTEKFEAGVVSGINNYIQNSATYNEHISNSSSNSFSEDALANHSFLTQPAASNFNSHDSYTSFNNPQYGSVPPAGPATNNYRIGNLKKPIYAPAPNLSSSTQFSPIQQYTVTTSVADTFTRNSANPHYSALSSHQVDTVEETMLYHPVYHHWFYCVGTDKNWVYHKDSDFKSVWKPFSMNDSLALESAFSLPTLTKDTVVATDGGRYDVNVVKREKTAVYWEDERRCIVRRCSWFYKRSNDNCYVPYEEEISSKLEHEYKNAMISNIWDRRIDVGDNEEVIMCSMNSIIHQFKIATHPLEDFSTESASLHLKPRVVKRGGFDEFDIDDGEPEICDHLLFLIHGIGQFCDLKFRSIIEVVDEFRNISLELVQSHFQEASDLGHVNRIELLPISWHKALHSEDTGIDARVKNITLPSIPRLRSFSNDTIMDVLFYNSPVYCQVIINAVALEMNKLYALFMKRNPNFSGKVSIGGHSLGSLIVFDLLCGQSANPQYTLPKKTPINEESEKKHKEEYDDDNDDDDDDNDDDGRKKEEECRPPPAFATRSRPSLTRKISFVTMGDTGTGQPYVKYPRLHFQPRFFFAFGSPTAGFLATRSSEILGETFKFPTCPGFFNIFHPYDPIAYRIEPLIEPSLSHVKPIQISHHKGRKRMHLELKETVTNVGQKLFDTVKTTWNMVYGLTAHKDMDNATKNKLDVNRVLVDRPMNVNLIANEPTTEDPNVRVGSINEGKRVDYVLQEAPVEYFNEYLFAITSHLCYWTSRDTMLMILKEIYSDRGVYSTSVNTRSSTPTNLRYSSPPMPSSPILNRFIDPTLPMKDATNIQPPPMSGFKRK